MKKKLLPVFGGFLLLATSILSAQTKINVFDKILFYDGYASLEKLDSIMEPVPEGVIRHKTSLMAKKLTEEQLNSFGTSILMEVIIKAACDNYDRIGNVNLALVEKDSTTYNPSDVEKIEIGRFITPFMNKNYSPDTVPYLFDVSNLIHILRDEELQEQYNFWIELEVFGVPYAANEQVSGCAGRNDVFYGTLNFITESEEQANERNNVFIPLIFKQRFNNYQEEATDEIGKTVKSIEFEIKEDLSDAHLVLITSNHGANSGGEEYNRRWHYVYFDNEEVLKYKPGRTSCEPFRVYNTQRNGIYNSGGVNYMSDTEWQSFSNWCPGDIIDTRIISLGSLKAGQHSFKIEVPQAKFVGKDGNFPLSLYFQGKTEGELVLSITDFQSENLNYVKIFPNPVESNLTIETNQHIKNVDIYDISGQKVYQGNNKSIKTSNLNTGIYIIRITLPDGSVTTQKFIKQ